MTPPKLSISIPTFNRANELGVLLQSIVVAASNADSMALIEVNISDNGSTDATASVISRFRSKFLHYNVNKFPLNQGPDANFLAAAALASGDYIWFMGSDDAVSPESLNLLLGRINDVGFDIGLVDMLLCDARLRPFSQHTWIESSHANLVTNTATPSEAVTFFSLARPRWGLLFGYLSALIVRREQWESFSIPLEYKSSLFSFVYPVMRSIDHGAVIANISAPLVLNRGDNDSIGSEIKTYDQQFQRLALDIFWYENFSALLRQEKVRESYLSLAGRNYGWKYLIKLRVLASDKHWSQIEPKLRSFGVTSRRLWIARRTKTGLQMAMFLFVRGKNLIIRKV